MSYRLRHRMRDPHRLVFALAALALAGACIAGCRSEGPSPKGFALPADFTSRAAADEAVVLTIRDEASMRGAVYLDLETLASLPSETFASHDPWFDLDRTFTGVNIAHLLDALDLSAGATDLVFRATNDYEIAVPVATVRERRYILCYREDGRFYAELPDAHNKGPLSVAVDFDELSRAERDVAKFHNVWWLHEIVVR